MTNYLTSTSTGSTWSAGRVPDAGGSPALTSRLREEEEKLEDLRRKAQGASKRVAVKRPMKDGMEAARAVLRNAAELLGRERTTTRAALVAMLEPMKLTPANDGGPFYEVEAKIKTPANQEVSREVLNKTGCGGLQEAWESPAPGPLSLFLPRLRGARF